MSEKIIPSSIYETLGLVYFWCETELFPGGEREVGPVDLTVQRNFKGIPYMRSSSIKGALRSFYELRNQMDDANLLFGSTEQAGSIMLGNAEILAFPVKADRGLFLYVTSQSQISAYVREAAKSGKDIKEELWSFESGEALSAELEGEVDLMDGRYSLTLKKDKNLKTLAESIVEDAIPKIDSTPAPGYSYLESKLKKLILVNDTTFRELANNGLIIVLRIALDYERKAVVPERKAMFYQELIPEGTLLFAPLMKTFRSEQYQKEIDSFTKLLKGGLLLNLGGDETTGKGVVRIVMEG